MQLKHISTIDFADREGAGEAVPEAVLPDWDPPEQGICWPRGRGSRLVLPLLPGRTAGEMILLFEVVPCLAPPLLSEQVLNVRVNGVLQRRAALTYPGAISVHVPAALAAQRPALELELEHRDVVRPELLSAGHSHGSRSIGFRSLTMLAAQNRQPDAAAITKAPVLPPHEMLSDDELIRYFASLGDNCEFGLKQRRLGVEPMDLLRFAGADLPGLLLGLSESFAGIIAPGAIDLELHEHHPRDEYVLSAPRYHFRSHTGQFEGDMDTPRLYIREMKKLTVMQRLLAGDLASGHRILVFKHNELTEHSDISPMLRAIAARGPATLLHVVRDPGKRRLGQVERIGPNHLRGYIDAFNPYSDASKPSSALWLEICRNAYRMWRASRLAKGNEDAPRADVA